MPFVILTKIFIFFGFSGELLSKSLILGIFTLSGVSIFAYLRFLKLRYLTSLIGGFIWITMPFFFDYTIMGWMFVLFSIGAVMPITLIAFTKSIKNHNISYSIIAGLLYSIAILQSQSLIWYPMVLVAMSFALIKDKKTFYQYVKSFIIVITIGLLLHLSWWPGLFINNDQGVMNSDLALDPISQGMRARLNFSNILRGWGSLFNQPYEVGYSKSLLPLSFLIPIMAFGSMLQNTPNRKGLKISMLTIFLYMFLLFSIEPEIMSKIPLSNLIRDTARFTVLSSLALTILASFFIDYLIVKVKELWLIMLIVLLVTVNSYTFILGGLTQPALNIYDERLRTYQFPNDYIDTEKYLNSIQNDTKSYYPPSGTNISIKKNPKFNGDFKEIKDPFRGYSPLPGTIYMYYSSMGKPGKASFLLESLFNDEISKKSLSLLGMMNIGYIVNRNDTAYKHTQTQNIEKLVKSVGEKNISTFGNVQVIKNDYFLPHFYVPQKTIYLQNEINSLPNAINFNDYNARSVTYLTKGKSLDYIGQLPKPDILISEAIPVRKLNSEFQDIDKLLYPTVNNEPHTLKWFLSQISEKYYIAAVRNKPLNKADVLIWLASKRVAEITKYKPTKEIEAELINDYNKKAKEAVSILQKRHDDQVNEDDVVTEEYLEMAKKVLTYMSKSIYLLKKYGYEFMPNDNPNIIYNDFYTYLDKIAHLSCSKNCYVVNIPENGQYEIFVSKQEINAIDTSWELFLQIQNDNKQESYIQSSAKDAEKIEIDWYKIGEAYLTRGDNHTANISLNETPNLVGNQDWKSSTEIDDSASNNLGLSSQSILPGYTEHEDPVEISGSMEAKLSYTLWNNGIVYKQIPNLELQQKYKISFDYYTDRGELGISIIEDVLDYETAYQTDNFDWQSFENNKLKFPVKTNKLLDTKISQTNDYTKQLDNRIKSDFKKDCTTQDTKCFSHFESTIESNNPTVNTFLYLYSIPHREQKATINVRNLRIQKIINPKLMLRKVMKDDELPIQATIPKLEFVKVNPIKYKILVSGAKDPYTLIFSESFHEGWKLYKISGNFVQKDNDLFIGTIGKLGKFITSFFVKDHEYGKEVANYFDGEIKEGTHNNIFIEPGTFDTWGKQTVADNRHFQVNGYANAWYISPTATNNEENYEIIVEFLPQRIFYIGLAISSLTFIFLILYLIYIYLRRNKSGTVTKEFSNSRLFGLTHKLTIPITISETSTKIIKNYSGFIISKANYVKIIFLVVVIFHFLVITQNILLQLVLLFLPWIYLIKVLRLNNYSIEKLTLGSLAIIPLLLMIKQPVFAEKIALWTFIFLITTLAKLIHNYKKQDFKDE